MITYLNSMGKSVVMPSAVATHVCPSVHFISSPWAGSHSPSLGRLPTTRTCSPKCVLHCTVKVHLTVCFRLGNFTAFKPSKQPGKHLAAIFFEDLQDHGKTELHL